ncbi:MAG: ABC transporter ATP-binding protein [Simplicispira sp.]|nr:ABC transporter ATP-binding protein [Simplicispira sp.]
MTLSVGNLGKEYRLYASPRQRLKALLTGRSYHRSHWALRDVSLTLHRGQCLGVIGDNGAGKSSLLKLLAGTLQPSTGSITRAGRVTAILELGAGFHPDFTGRQNLYFGGSLIGISAAEMATLEQGIIDFSELGEAIDRPVKTYSSGMTVRLAFALVTAVEPQLLIIDEALAVGDQHFQKKCVERIESFRNHGCTILFCSHSLYHVQQLCDTTLWLKGGQVQAYGPTLEVLAAYEVHVRAQERGDADSPPAAGQAARQIAGQAAGQGAGGAGGAGTSNAGATPDPAAPASTSAVAGAASENAPRRAARIESLTLAEMDGANPPLLQTPDLLVTVRAHMPEGEVPSIGVMLEQAHGVGITSVTTHNDGVVPRHLDDNLWQVQLRFTDLPLHSGEYVVSAYLFDAKGLVVYEEWLQYARFRHVYPLSMPGLVRLPHQWE